MGCLIVCIPLSGLIVCVVDSDPVRLLNFVLVDSDCWACLLVCGEGGGGVKPLGWLFFLIWYWRSELVPVDGLESSTFIMVLWSEQGLYPRTWCCLLQARVDRTLYLGTWHFLLWAGVDAPQEPQAKRLPLPPGTVQSLSHHPSSFKKGKTWISICSDLTSLTCAPGLSLHRCQDLEATEESKEAPGQQWDPGTPEP